MAKKKHKKTYVCKKCEIDFKSLGYLKEHYRKYPSHRPKKGNEPSSNQKSNKQSACINYCPSCGFDITSLDKLAEKNDCYANYCTNCGFDISKLHAIKDFL